MRFFLLICLIVLLCDSCIASDSGCCIAECINNGNDDLSTAIICNICVAKGLSNSDGSSRMLRQKLKSIGVYDGHQKKVTDLNVDMLLLIFEHLDSKDILNLAKSAPAPTIYAAAKHAFYSKYKDYSVHMADNYDIDEILFEDHNKRIFIQLNKGAEILRVIGSEVRDRYHNQQLTSLNVSINMRVIL